MIQPLKPTYAIEARAKYFQEQLDEVVKAINIRLSTTRASSDGSVRIWSNELHYRDQIINLYLEAGWDVRTRTSDPNWLIFRFPETNKEGPYR